MKKKANNTNQADTFFVRAAHKKWSAYLWRYVSNCGLQKCGG